MCAGSQDNYLYQTTPRRLLQRRSGRGTCFVATSAPFVWGLASTPGGGHGAPGAVRPSLRQGPAGNTGRLLLPGRTPGDHFFNLNGSGRLLLRRPGRTPDDYSCGADPDGLTTTWWTSSCPVAPPARATLGAHRAGRNDFFKGGSGLTTTWWTGSCPVAHLAQATPGAHRAGKDGSGFETTW